MNMQNKMKQTLTEEVQRHSDLNINIIFTYEKF